jgi:hypothetical protein
MPLIKTRSVSVEEEVKRKEHREKQKELMVEVMAIRQAIIELFNTEPGTGFSNNEIYDWLIGKGINITRRQINPKMQMMKNVFYQEYGTRPGGPPYMPKNHGVWFRKVCSVCKKPIGLDDELGEFPERHLMRHYTCMEFISNICKEYNSQLSADTAALNVMAQQKDGLQTELVEKELEIKKLRAMIVTPSTNPNPQARRITL